MKTWGRELAIVMLLILGWFVYDGNIDMVEALALPVCLFSSSVFTGKHFSNGLLGK